MKQASAKLLILMVSPLDRIAHALRVVASFKQQLPGLEVTWIARRVYAPVVESFDCVDRVIPFCRSGGLVEAIRLARELRREKFDYVFDFEGHARTGMMCWIARGTRKVGRKNAREGATVCYREVVGDSVQSQGHVLEEMLEFGSVFGLGKELKGKLVPKSSAALPRSWIDAKAAGKRCICLFPGRFKRDRAWPEMLRLGRELTLENADYSVFLLGLKGSGSAVQEVGNLHDLRGEASWPQICAMLANADLTVSNDNGPGQLAGALACPNLTLYSFVMPARRGSYPLDEAMNQQIVAPRGDVSLLDYAAVKMAVEKLLGL